MKFYFSLLSASIVFQANVNAASQLDKLDTRNDTFPFWKLDSFSYRGHLHYFDSSSVIDKTLLNLTHPDEFDLGQFNDVKGVWVFPHKYFPEDPYGSPNDTLIGVLAFQSDFSLFDGSLTVTYFTYNGGEIKIFNDTTEWNQLAWAKFESESETSGWATRTVNFPTATSRFRVELHAEDDGDFVFIDKITISPNRNDTVTPELTEPPPASTTIQDVRTTEQTEWTEDTSKTFESSQPNTENPTEVTKHTEETTTANGRSGGKTVLVQNLPHEIWFSFAFTSIWYYVLSQLK